MTSSTVRDAAWDLIYEYDLHFRDGVEFEYVDLEPLECAFPIVEEHMPDSHIQGWVVPPDGHISRWNPCPIVLSPALDPAMKRVAYAHEVGHALMGHKGTYTRGERPGQRESPKEREAWVMAAMILVPVAAIFNHGEVDKIASACEVPAWLVELVR